IGAGRGVKASATAVLMRPADGEWANSEWGGSGAPLLYALLASLAGGAVRRGGGAARHGGAVERHALNAAAEDLRPLRGQRARVDTHPGDLRGQAAVLDLRAAVHHHLESVRFPERRRLVVADAELHPHHA